MNYKEYPTLQFKEVDLPGLCVESVKGIVVRIGYLKTGKLANLMTVQVVKPDGFLTECHPLHIVCSEYTDSFATCYPAIVMRELEYTAMAIMNQKMRSEGL